MNMKSKKKVFNKVIQELNNIDVRLRDYLLTRYIYRCQRVHALIFF